MQQEGEALAVVLSVALFTAPMFRKSYASQLYASLGVDGDSELKNMAVFSNLLVLISLGLRCAWTGKKFYERHYAAEADAQVPS